MILAQAQMTFPSVSWLAIGPEIALALGAVVVLLVDINWRPPTRVLGWIAGLAVFAGLGLAVAEWARVDELVRLGTGAPDFMASFRPFAGMITLDPVAVIARFVLLVITGLSVPIGWEFFERMGRRAAEALALVLLSAVGFSLMASSLHLVMMFLGLEVGSIALYVLAGFARERRDSDEAAIKYFLLGSVASAVFIYGAALVFAGSGQLNLVDIASRLAAVDLTKPGVLLIGLALMMAGLAFKVSAAPFHSWAPDVYQGAPAGLVGYMASAAKIGGFAALVRVLTFGFADMAVDWVPLVAAIAVVSMLVGSLVAVVQSDLRRMLAYSGVAHAGFILTGVVAGRAGSPQVWFYLAVYTLQLVGAFGVVSVVSGGVGSRSPLSAYTGLSKRHPLLAGVLTVLLLGMSGLPLTSGFIAKFGVFRQAWQAGYEWLVIVALLASVVAFFFYLRVIVLMYMNEPEEDVVSEPNVVLRWVLVALAVATLVLGMFPGPLLDLTARALPL